MPPPRHQPSNAGAQPPGPGPDTKPTTTPSQAEPSYTPIACIGTGVSGICLGATLARWYSVPPGAVAFFSRDPAPGGTWCSNTYPGAACDVPSALYSFSFERNPDWSRVLPAQRELRAYLDRVVDKYGLRERMVFGVEAFRCEWIEDGDEDKAEGGGRWRVWLREVGASGESRAWVHECRVLFSAVGQLSQARELDVPGLERFEGPVFHSARWIGDVDLSGKRVVLFGNGCTAAQIVPAIVGRTKHLTQVVRSKHWVYPPIDAGVPEWVQVFLRVVPGLGLLLRFGAYLLGEAAWKGFGMTKSAAEFRRRKRRKVEEYMRKMAPEKYHDMLIPDFEVGCKRRIFNPSYLESLHAENITLTDERVADILPDGVRMQSGEVLEADVIILANGFKTNYYLGDVEVIGRGGETLEHHWDSFGGQEAYNCTAVSGFPNLFFLLGPNTATGHTSTIMAIENAVNYSLRILKPVLEGRASVAHVKRSAEEDYVSSIQAALKDTVWMSGCNSWYIRGPGPKVWNGTTYPWSQAYFWYSSLFPIWSDWEYTGNQCEPLVRERRRPATWLVTLLALLVGGVTVWSESRPGSRLVSPILPHPGPLAGLKYWARVLLPKAR